MAIDDNLPCSGNLAGMVTIYDISLDARRPVTQEDIDVRDELLAKLSKLNTPIEIRGFAEHDFDFKLACYVNPARDDGLFVAEDKTIEPYPMRGLSGERLYPAIPNTPYRIGTQLSPDFARELVRRWNRDEK